MGRYVVFAYDAYYPTGGWNDHVLTTDSLDDATHAAMVAVVQEKRPYGFSEVVDIAQGAVIKEFVWSTVSDDERYAIIEKGETVETYWVRSLAVPGRE